MYCTKYTFKVFPFLPLPQHQNCRISICFNFLENFVSVRLEKLIILLHYDHQDEAIDYIKVFLLLQSILDIISFTSVISKMKRSSNLIQKLFRMYSPANDLLFV